MGLGNAIDKHRGVAAVAASFLVYLAPLVGPHAVFVVGAHLGMDISMLGRRPLAWILTDCAVALVAQLAFGGLCYWILRKPRFRAALLLLAVPVLAAALNWVYQITIPTHFLIEAASETEQSPWPEHCIVPNASLMNLTATASAALAASGQALVRMDAGGLGLLHLPACSVTSLALPANPSLAPLSVVPSGAALASDWIVREGRKIYWYAPASGPAVSVDSLITDASNTDASPILSSDGTAIAWIRRIAGRENPLPPELRVEAVDRSSSHLVPLEKFGPGTWVPLAVDVREGTALLARNLREYLLVDLKGEIRWGPFRPEGADPQPQTLLRTEGGWFAWDAYRDEAAYRLAWSFGAGDRSYTIRKGFAIESAAARPAGDYVAYSATCSYSLGDFRDFVSVIRTSDSKEVLHKSLSRYTRSSIAFPADDYFAYSEVQGTHMAIRVLRVAPASNR